MTDSFIHRGRVRYAETDAMGVAHHGSYATWLEEARIRALDDLGASYRDLEAGRCFMPVVELSIRYRRPLRFDDHFRIESTLTAGPSRMRFASTILDEAGGRIADAEVIIAAVDGDGVPMRIPAEILRALEEREERGETG